MSRLREHAINIFDITDIKAIKDRETSAQVVALRNGNSFLYAQGDTGSLEQYLRSDCIIKGGPFTSPILQTPSYYAGTPCFSVGPGSN